jgi:hypothetical protein
MMKNNSKKAQIELINNQFELDEAKNLLMQLIQDKINFHVSKNFSHQERFGSDDHLSKQKIDHLKTEKDQLKTLFDTSSEDYSKVKIETTIFITFN